MREGVQRDKTLVAQVIKSAAVKLIGSGTRHGIHDASRGSSVLGREVTGFHLEFTDRLLTDRIRNCRAAPLLAKEGLVVIRSVHHRVVVDSGRTVKAHEPGSAVIRGGWREKNEIFPTSTVHRQILD